MITNTGKGILTRYLLGQATDYASYIALGCGAKPLDVAANYDTSAYALKNSLDFEMFRVPIISRGTVTENGVTKIVLTAELPTENRYEISEIGVFSAQSNTVLGAASSRNLFSFSGSESWTFNSQIPSLILPSIDDGSGNIDTSITGLNAFYLNSDNPIFNNENRKIRYETPRFMNSSIVLPGNSGRLTETNGVLTTSQYSIPLKMTAASVNLDSYSVDDEIKIAISAINKLNAATTLGAIRVKIDFKYNADAASPIATIDAVIQDTVGNDIDFDANRYFIISKKLSDFVPPNFSWSSVTIVDIYVSAHEIVNNAISDTASDNFFIAIDGMRIENSESNNPLYGMIGYSVFKTQDAKTIIKSLNSSSYVEFRFALGVN